MVTSTGDGAAGVARACQSPGPAFAGRRITGESVLQRHLAGAQGRVAARRGATAADRTRSPS